MQEADFAISCSQCGGEGFREVFPVPAETYQLYGAEAEQQRPQLLTASIYACLQCGHLEKLSTCLKKRPQVSMPSRRVTILMRAASSARSKGLST